MIDVNLSSVFRLCRAAGRQMLARGAGKIINVASLLSFQGGIRVPAYAAAKGGVAQLTKALANEWAGRGVNVNAIAPGYMRTDNTRALRDDPVRYAATSPRASPRAAGASRRISRAPSCFSRPRPRTTCTVMCWSSMADGWDDERTAEGRRPRPIEQAGSSPSSA